MIFIILSIIFIYFTALIDANHIKAQQYFEDHAPRLYQRIAVGLLIAYFAPMKGVVLALLFWAFFDSILNYLLGKDIFYIGETAWTDKLFRGKFNLFAGSKVIALILAVLLS